jgi:Domain of unknown function (DUF4365)
VQRVTADYGLDIVIRTFDARGQIENGEVPCQVKATDHLPLLAERAVIPWRVQASDLRHWLNEPMPVILIIYDAAADKAYWLNVQQYFQGRRTELGEVGRTVTLHVPVANVVNEVAVKEFARYRDGAMALRIRRIPGHE